MAKRARPVDEVLRGGSRQRLATHESQRPTPKHGDSALAELLVRYWAWGFLSPQMVQKIAAAAASDIRRYKDDDLDFYEKLKMLQGLGSEGRHSNNMNAELRTKLAKDHHFKNCILDVKLPLSKPGCSATTFEGQVIILPHAWFSAVFHSYKSAWKEHILPDVAKLNQFWDDMSGNPQMVGHNVRSVPNFRSRAIPISLHGDGVPVTGVGKAWSHSANMYSWCSLLGAGSTMLFNFYIYHIWAKCISKAETMESLRRFWMILTWSLKWLYLGLWPNTDWNDKPFTSLVDIRRAGTPLAGERGSHFFCVPWVIRNDLEFQWKDLLLPNSNSKDEPCAFCPASAADGADISASDFNLWSLGSPRDAKWISRIYTSSSWMKTRWVQHELFTRICKGITVLTVYPDLMHAKYLGVDQYFLGSVLYMLCFELMPKSPKDNCKDLLLEIKRVYKRQKTPSRYTGMVLSMFCDGKKPPGKMPCLKGRAAEARYLGPAIAEVWKIYFDNSNMQHVQIATCLDQNLIIEDILQEHPRSYVLPPEAARRFKHAIFSFLACFNALGSHYMAANVKLFDITIKAHYLAHAALRASELNPRLGWCFSGEDFMKHAKKLLGMCATGTCAQLTSRKFADQYLVAMHATYRDKV